MNDLRKIGLTIKMKRHELGITQEALADLSKVERTYISGIENGRRNVSLAIFLQLSQALDIDPWILLKTSLSE